MKKHFKFPFMILTGIVLALAFASCGDDNDVDNSANSDEFKSIVQQYLDHTIAPTYDSLSSASITLYKKIAALKANKTTENLQAVATYWKKARVFWERSEAFLYGPAKSLGTDGHIDTWPMDISAFNGIMANTSVIASYDGSNGDIAVATIDNTGGLLGFHSIEYVIFKDGQLKNIDEITSSEIIYITAVAGDLRNQCCLLEAGWFGVSKLAAEKITYAQRAPGFDFSSLIASPYQQIMRDATSISFPSQLASCTAILDGCFDIADEVATKKMGMPYSGEDKSYIESPFSYNSQTDFADNIRSIANAYLGGFDENNRGASISDYIRQKNTALDTQIRNAITETIAKIQAIDQFEETYQSTKTKSAIDACVVLRDLLTKAKTTLKE